MKSLIGLVLAVWAMAFGLAGGCDCGGDNWVKVADCATGPAWHIGGELICDDHQQTTFAARNWNSDTPATACAFCEENRP